MTKYSKLDTSIHLADVSLLYPFFFNANFTILEDGWLAFSLETEYAKYRTHPDFRLTNINRDFKVIIYSFMYSPAVVIIVVHVFIIIFLIIS